jgi:hypothetical protein
VVQSVVDIASNPIIAGGPVCPLPFEAAQHAGTFRDSFTAATGLPFTPSAFRTWRLSLIDGSHAMLVIPVHRSCPIRTSLLQELDGLVEARYQLFTRAGELIEALQSFLTSCNAGAASFGLGKARN